MNWIFDNEEDALKKESFIRNDWNDPPFSSDGHALCWVQPVSVNRKPKNNPTSLSFRPKWIDED